MEILRGLVSLISLLNYILFYCLHHNDLKTLQIGFICITLLTEHHQQIDGSCNLQATLPWEQLWSSWTHWQRSHDQNRFVSSRTGTKTAVNVGGWACSNQTWGHLCNKAFSFRAQVNWREQKLCACWANDSPLVVLLSSTTIMITPWIVSDHLSHTSKEKIQALLKEKK